MAGGPAQGPDRSGGRGGCTCHKRRSVNSLPGNTTVFFPARTRRSGFKGGSEHPTVRDQENLRARSRGSPSGRRTLAFASRAPRGPRPQLPTDPGSPWDGALAAGAQSPETRSFGPSAAPSLPRKLTSVKGDSPGRKRVCAWGTVRGSGRPSHSGDAAVRPWTAGQKIDGLALLTKMLLSAPARETVHTPTPTYGGARRRPVASQTNPETVRSARVRCDGLCLLADSGRRAPRRHRTAL